MAFENLKVSMTKAPVSSLSDFSKTLILQTDASGRGLGAVLHQTGHTIAFLSKTFCSKLKMHPDMLRNYMQLPHQIKSGNITSWAEIYNRNCPKELGKLMGQVVQTPDQHYYLSKLLGNDYEIKYKPGKDSKAADALSRVDLPSTSQVLILSTISFDFLKQVKDETASCKYLQNLKQALQSQLEKFSDITCVDGILYQQNRIILSSTSALKSTLLHQFHSTTTCGHVGASKNYSCLNVNFSWTA